MPSQVSRRKSTVSVTKNVALVSIGSVEEKLALVLSPLLLSSGLELSFCKNYPDPRDLTAEIIHEISHQLQQIKMECVIFDIRIHEWKNTTHLKRSRAFSQYIHDHCADLRISHSVILSNGDLYLGNALGDYAEKREVRDVLKGEGPLDLTKFVLEMGVDFLLLTRKMKQRIDAKQSLRDKIISGKLSLSCLDISERTTLTSSTEGYVHHLVLDKLQSIRSFFHSTHPGIGLFLKKKTGDWVAKGDTIVDMYCPKGQKMPVEEETFQRMFVMDNMPPPFQPLLLERMELKIYD